MNKLIAVLIGLAVVAIIVFTFFLRITYISPGEVGIKIDKMGHHRTVTTTDIRVGRVFYNPITTGFVRYPVKAQRIVWTRSDTEGSPNNDEIDFNSKEGLKLTADVALTVTVQPDCAPQLYNTYRQSLDTLIQGTIRDVVRENMRKVSSNMGVEDIIGSGADEFNQKAKDGITKQLAAMCVDVKEFSVLGTIRVPDSVSTSIHQKIQAQQDALTELNKVKTAQAKADQMRAEAQGKADSAVIEAKGEAEALKIRGQALANNPEILQLEAIQQWNGVLPQYMQGSQSGALPFGILVNPPSK